MTRLFSPSRNLSYIVVAHGVNVVLQVAFSIVGQYDSTQLAISSKVEASVSGEHQQASHIPPTDLILRDEKEIIQLVK